MCVCVCVFVFSKYPGVKKNHEELANPPPRGAIPSPVDLSGTVGGTDATFAPSGANVGEDPALSTETTALVEVESQSFRCPFGRKRRPNEFVHLRKNDVFLERMLG